jgi:hypothetical protein
MPHFTGTYTPIHFYLTSFLSLCTVLFVKQFREITSYMKNTKNIQFLSFFLKALSYAFVGFASKSNEKNLKTTLFLTAILSIIIFSCTYNQILSPTVDKIDTSDGHGLASLDRGVSKAFCKYNAKMNIRSFVHGTPTDVDINKLFFNDETSQKEYCDKASYFILNEISLSNLYGVLFKIVPDITIKETKTVTSFIKLFLIFTMCFFFIKIGMSLVFVFTVGLFTCFFVFNLLNEPNFYGIYTFFIPLYFGLISLYISVLILLKNRKLQYLPLLSVIGFYASFYSNFRTSHSVVILVTFFVFLFCLVRIYKNFYTKKKLAILCLATSLFYMVGIKAHNYLFITPVQTEIHEGSFDNNYNYMYHAIAHPVVLALSLVESDLAKREGIEWNDLVGEKLSQKIDPSTTYLSKDYEKALFTYYAKLWIYYPKEMLNIYLSKIKNTTIFSSENMIPYQENIFLRYFRLIKLTVSSNILPLLVLLLSFILILKFSNHLNVFGLFFGLTTILSTFLLYLEAVLIYHVFWQSYHTLVNILYIIILLSYLQVIINYFLKKSHLLLSNQHKFYNQIKGAQNAS